MDGITNNLRFAETFQRLAEVRLNPRRHTAANALEHSEAVAAKAQALARANGCSERETRILEDLGRAHDIGKVTGTARPERSLAVLRECGIDDEEFLALVKWHDTSLPWFRSNTKGQPPSDKAWRRLALEVDVRLLAMFMVADRVDAPPGWRKNAPTMWFLEQARQRGLISELCLDLPGQPSEVQAGAVLRKRGLHGPEVLLTRVDGDVYELPSGSIEWDELPLDAAIRLLHQEAGVKSEPGFGELGHVDRLVEASGERYLRRIHYFALSPIGHFGADVQELKHGKWRWSRRDQAARTRLVDDALRPVLMLALGDDDV